MTDKNKCPHEGDITYLDLIQVDGCPQYVVRCKDCDKLGIIYLIEGDEDWDAFTNSEYKPEHKHTDLNSNELEFIQNAMLFYAEAEQIENENEQEIFDSAYNKLGQLYD